MNGEDYKWNISREWSQRWIRWLLHTVEDDWRNARVSRDFFDKMRERGFTRQQIGVTISSSESYVGRYWHGGNRVGFWHPRNQLFIAWKPNSLRSPSRLMSGFFLADGVDYLSSQIDFREIRGSRK